MKHLIAFLLVLGSFAALGQENNLSLTGGYSTTTGNVAGSAPTGYKVSLNYDFQSTGETWSVGGAVGYIGLDGTATVSGLGTSTYKITSIPVYAVAKYYVGSEKFKVFARLAIGSHFSSGSYSGPVVTLKDTSAIGMSFGGGAGINFWLSEKIFLTADYEYLWLSNAISDTGGVSSASGGIGMRF
jgi:hypothetical protein